VELEHRHLSRLVDGQSMYGAIGGAGGRKSVLEAFATAAAKQD
jgi:hypothetical protein